MRLNTRNNLNHANSFIQCTLNIRTMISVKIRRNLKHHNRFLKHKISNVSVQYSKVPHLSLQAHREPCAEIILMFIKTARSAHQGTPTLTSAPVVALVLSRLFPFFRPLTCPFLISLSFFPNYRVTVVIASPERREGHTVPVAAAPREQEERAVRAKRTRGVCRPRLPRRPRRRAAGARGPHRPHRPRCRRAEGAKQARCPRRCRCRRSAEILPFSPPPAPAQRRDPVRDVANNHY